MYIIVLLLLPFVATLLYTFGRMVGSFWSRQGGAPVVKERGVWVTLDILTLLFILLLLLAGFVISSHEVQGGLPLHAYENSTGTVDHYSSLSHTYSLILMVNIPLGLTAFLLIRNLVLRMSPVLYTVCCSLLLFHIGFAGAYVAQTGFTHYDSYEVFFLQFAYVTLSFLYIAQLKRSFDILLAFRQEPNEDNASPAIRWLYRVTRKYRYLPLFWIVALFPVQLLLQLVLMIFGQRPDLSLRVLVETSTFHYSQLPVPPPEIIPGDGHYLCTVAAKGHASIVKPVRSGIRRGEVIPVNRQLMVANAFENVLEQYMPKVHLTIRRLYDKYGYPLSKHINTRWSADLVYILMKPLEWLFLLVLYTVDRNPENRIYVQYSGLNKKADQSEVHEP